MALAKDFDRRLDKLWHRRTASLRRLVRRGSGPPATLTTKQRERAIMELQEIAERILTRQGAKRLLRRLTHVIRSRAVRGRGLDDRYWRIVDWADDKLRGPVIYSFWRGRRCLYVGKGSSPRRLRAYRKTVYLREATRLSVRTIHRGSELGQAECLSVHLHQPRDNTVSVARHKWTKRCPICTASKQIRRELRAMFKMR